MQFFSFNIADLILAPEDVARAVKVSCMRGGIMRPQGIVQLREEFSVIAVPAATPPQDLQFQRLEYPTRQELNAVTEARWRGGYDIVGAVTLPDSGEVLVLFQKI